MGCGRGFHVLYSKTNKIMKISMSFAHSSKGMSKNMFFKCLIGSFAYFIAAPFQSLFRFIKKSLWLRNSRVTDVTQDEFTYHGRVYDADVYKSYVKIAYGDSSKISIRAKQAAMLRTGVWKTSVLKEMELLALREMLNDYSPLTIQPADQFGDDATGPDGAIDEDVEVSTQHDNEGTSLQQGEQRTPEEEANTRRRRSVRNHDGGQ